jgi:hypothetical protein
MKTITYISAVFLLLGLSFTALAQSFDFGGFIDSYHAVRLQDPYDFMSSRSRLRTEIRGIKGNSSFYTSINANVHNLLPERCFFELREAYLEYAGSNWDLRAGRQIIIWGVSDGIRITDIIAPMDFTEFLARDYDDIRMPVDAMKLRFFNNNIKMELVFIPVFQSFIYPTDSQNPWNIFPESEAGPEVILTPASTPATTLKNSEIGGRFSFYLSGIDMSLVSLYTWNKLPVFNTIFSSGMDTTFLVPEHHRLFMAGLDLSTTLGSLVVRGEGAYFAGEYYPSELNGSSTYLITRDVIRTLLGLDWYPGSEWTLTGQLSHTYIVKYCSEMSCEQHNVLATLGVSKKLLRSTLSISTFGYMDLSNKGFFNRTSIDYSLSDPIHLCAGVDLFGGDGGMFGIYKDNSEVWIKVKYSF